MEEGSRLETVAQQRKLSISNGFMCEQGDAYIILYVSFSKKEKNEETVNIIIFFSN